MVPFISGQLQNLSLALAIAKRGNLPGAEALVGQQFEQLFASGAFKEAAEVAADSPKVCACMHAWLCVCVCVSVCICCFPQAHLWPRMCLVPLTVKGCRPNKLKQAVACPALQPHTS